MGGNKVGIGSGTKIVYSRKLNKWSRSEFRIGYTDRYTPDDMSWDNKNKIENNRPHVISVHNTMQTDEKIKQFCSK